MAFDTVMGLVSETFQIRLDDVLVAKGVVCGSYGLSARNAVHIAVIKVSGLPEHVLASVTCVTVYARYAR